MPAAPPVLTFDSAGERLAGDLFLPAGGDGPWPAVVTASGFGGVKEMLLPRFAQALADVGIACLAFDYPNFGASTGTPRQHVDLPAQRRSFRDALDALAVDPRIDSQRLGAWGPSLAGGHVLHLAASDDRIKAAVAIVPFIAFRARPSLPLVLAPAQDLARRALRRSRTTIAIAGPPGATAAMTGDRAEQWISQASANAERFRNEVTAASLLQMARHSNRKAAGRIPTPLRVILASDDTITPAAMVRKATAGSPNVDTIEQPGTHFELLDDDLQHTIELTTQWFITHLAAAPVPA